MIIAYIIWAFLLLLINSYIILLLGDIIEETPKTNKIATFLTIFYFLFTVILIIIKVVS